MIADREMTMSESRAPFRKIVGKTYPTVGEIVVQRTHDNQHYPIDGTPYTTPQREEIVVEDGA